MGSLGPGVVAGAWIASRPRLIYANTPFTTWASASTPVRRKSRPYGVKLEFGPKNCAGAFVCPICFISSSFFPSSSSCRFGLLLAVPSIHDKNT
jgi:hypothetical protein